MKTIEYRTVDKSEWGPGEWQDEPDKVQFMDEATGLPCLCVRNRMGSWCGYVGVSEGHPLYEKSYNDAGNIDVHGGLTFADHCAPMEVKDWEQWREMMLKRKDEAITHPNGDAAEYWREDGKYMDDYDGWKADRESNSICHLVQGDDKVWWLGFDCGHFMDLQVGLRARLRKYKDECFKETDSDRMEVYRTLAYVQAECRSLAAQLKELANGNQDQAGAAEGE